MLRKISLLFLFLVSMCFFPLSGEYAEAAVGNASTTILFGTNPVNHFSSVKVYDYDDGEVTIDVKLPGYIHSYVLSRPLGFMPGWLASIDDSNTVTVKSPEGLKYIYPVDCNHMLGSIKDANDVNIVTFEYNVNDVPTKQKDGFDPDNLYLEYKYDAEGLLEKIVAQAYDANRVYTIDYDEANRVVAITSGSCTSCGGGGDFRYEYDSSGLLKKITDANDPNIVIYEYEYDSKGRVTDTYLGDVNNSNHIREFIYYDGTGASFIQDTYDYINADTYRVTREYKNSAGFVTKRIKYDNLDEEPDDPVGESFTERIVYSYDANNSITKKIVIPPLSDYNDADPSPKGIRKEYAYDPDTAKMLTERWFDANDVNFPVSLYEYEYTPDGNNIRILSYTDARGAKAKYSYDGNDVDPNLKTMPKVTEGISGTQRLKYRYTYDNRNRLTLEEQLDDANNPIVKAKYEYDNYGNLIKRYDDYQGNNQEVTKYKYSGFNEMTRTRLPSWVVQGWAYNDDGQLESEFVLANPDDFNEPEPNLISQTKYTYDANGRVESVARAKDDGVFSFGEPDAWIWTEYEYDLWGRRTKVIEDVDDLALATSYEYNNQNEVTKVALPNGKWTETIRDGRGLVWYTHVGHGQTTVATTEFEYDGNGNLACQTGPDGIKTKYEYDDFDRVVKVKRGL